MPLVMFCYGTTAFRLSVVVAGILYGKSMASEVSLRWRMPRVIMVLLELFLFGVGEIG